VFALNSIIRNNSALLTAFIDLKKCFDFINREMMLYKLLLNGIDEKLYKSIRNIYQHSSSCVRINNKLIEWFDCNSGAKQGDNLSPTIFSVFINDFVKEIEYLSICFEIGGKKISFLLYADDIFLLAETEKNLQILLDTLHEWCKRWRVLLNSDKSKCVHFRKGRAKQSTQDFRIGNSVLENVQIYKYHGVLFSSNGKFSCNAETLGKGAGRALGKVISKIHPLKSIGIKTFEKLYNSCVVPILDYCSGVWGYRKFQSLENVQHRAIRYTVLHLYLP
jgi:hypothetical protein